MINKATLLGRIGKKELRNLTSGNNVCNITIATNKKYTDNQGQKRDLVTWHNVNFFGRLSDVANRYCHVGDLVYIEGEITNKKVDQNGITKVFSSINAFEIKFIPTGKKYKDEENEPNGNIVVEEIEDDDIPF